MSGSILAAYQAVCTGIAATDPSKRRVAFLVSTADLSRDHEDTYVAAGLGRQLAKLGAGVRLVPETEWYSADYADGELLIALLPTINVRRLPARSPAVAWVQNLAERWGSLVGLESFSAVLASSELSRDLLAERFAGPVGLLPLGFDEDLLLDPGRSRRLPRSLVSVVEHKDAHRRMRVAAGRPSSGIPRQGRGVADLVGLPTTYRRSVLAVEQLPGADLGWGNHTSTLLDGLACGAAVATNSRLGLAELGLDRLPVYRTSGELAALVRRAAAGEFRALVDELRAGLAARHSYAVRAAALLAFAAEHDLWALPRRTGRVINFFPDWSRGNPYQRMLYSRLPADVRTVPSTDPVRHLVLRDDGGDLSDQVLHVHWQDYILQPSPSYAEASRRLSEVTANITELKSRGLKVVWTIHNRMPHDVKYYFHEIEVCQYLADNADVIHVLSEQTLVAVRDLFEIDPAKVVVVEHGSYVGVYPELLDRATARARLGLLPSERVVLFFGGLRPYKGLEQLIESFDRVHRDDPTTRLLIVGQPGHAMDKSFLRFIEGLPFVTTRIGFVPESDVHVYFRAADVQVAPYTAVLNSGSVLLGLGYGLPIVAPRLGALESLAGEPFMFSYRAGSDSEFDTALRSAIAQAGDPSVAERATAFAAAYTGEDMSDTFVRDVLGRLFQTHGAPGRSLSRSG